MIELSTRKWATIKKTAQIVQPNVAKRAKLEEQIAKLVSELEEVNASIREWDGAVMRMTGGYSSSELITRVIEDTGKVDAKGQPVKVTKWVPTEVVNFNVDTNTYEIPEKSYAMYGECPCNCVGMELPEVALNTEEE